MAKTHARLKALHVLAIVFAYVVGVMVGSLTYDSSIDLRQAVLNWPSVCGCSQVPVPSIATGSSNLISAGNTGLQYLHQSVVMNQLGVIEESTTSNASVVKHGGKEGFRAIPPKITTHALMKVA